MGETSQACIEREVYEETGIHACAEHLAVVCENFFKGKGGKTDSGEELVWLSLDEIEASKIKPDFLKENIKSIIGAKETIHIIERQEDKDKIVVEVLPLSNYVRSAEEHQHHSKRHPEDCSYCHIPDEIMNKYRMK